MEQKYENRQFMIFNVSELENVDFTQVHETSSNDVRVSVDGTKTFVKWDGNQIPLSVDLLISKEGPYTYEEMSTILTSPEWSVYL